MRKQLMAICMMSVCVTVSKPVFISANDTEEVYIPNYDHLIYCVEDMTEGFQPEEGETLQLMTKDMVAEPDRLQAEFQQKWFKRKVVHGNAVLRIANPVEKLPCGQHHRFTLLVNSEKKQTVFWYSSQPEVARIDWKTGEMTALSGGKTRIWVEDKNGILQDEILVEIISELSVKKIEKLYIRKGSNLIGPYDHSEEFVDVKELFFPEDVPGLMECFTSKQLGQVRIPASVKAIAYNLTDSEEWGIEHGKKVSFSVDGNNTNYYSIDGVLFSYRFFSTEDSNALFISMIRYLMLYADCGKTALLVYPAEREAEEYYVPVGVERIAGRAFEGARYLRRVVLPDTVTHIGGDAFRGCVSLEEIVIPASVTVFEDNGWADAIDSWSMNGVTIVTPAGSAAEAYAIEHGFDYRNE